MTDLMISSGGRDGASPARWAGAARVLLLTLLVVSTAGPLLLPIRESDFFWHLKTGEWIWQHRALPGEFLFAAVPQGTPAATQRFAMTQYWLSQVTFHLVHAAGGMAAIVLLRFLLTGLLLWLLALSVPRQDLAGLGLLLLAACALAAFPPERPQFISFVLAAALLRLLDGFRTATSPSALWRRAVAVPLLTLFWSNCHGGYVVGLGLIALVAAGETLKRLHPNLEPLSMERWRILLGSGAAAVLSSSLNPNGWHAFHVAVVPAWLRAVINEYRSSIVMFQGSESASVSAYWLLLAIAVATIASRWRRPDPTAILLITVTAGVSFAHYRFVPFFIVAALPAAGRALPAGTPARAARALVAAAGICAGVLLFSSYLTRYRHVERLGEIDRVQFPVDAAALIERSGLRGNIFGLDRWGGYLLWRLAPAKVFIDGRNGDREVFEGYRAILTGEPRAGGASRQEVFASAGIHLAVTDYYDLENGDLRGLIDDLLADPSWTPIFSSPNIVAFAQATPENRDPLARVAIPKQRFVEQLLDYCTRFNAAVPGFAPPYVARGDLLLRLGDREGALRAWRQALRLAPDSRAARRRVESFAAR